jgi:photosystem II stability/assembly factor-like uncharacterized protein
LSGHTNYVYSVAFSPDGTKLASGSFDKTIKLWSVSTQSLLNTLTGHTYRVYSVAFSPDGTKLASGSLDNTIKLWNVSTGTLLRTIIFDHGYPSLIAYNNDGKKIASGGWGYKNLRIYDASVPPSIISSTINNITTTSVTLGATISSDGGFPIIERGIVYSTKKNPTTADNKVMTSGMTGTFTIDITGLNPGTTYHFRGYAMNVIGTSYTNDTIFTTKAIKPGVTQLTYPSNNANDISTSVILKWGYVNGATTYRLQLSTNLQFSFLVLDSSVNSSYLSFLVGGLLNSSVYYWRIQASNSAGNGDWSDVWSFTTWNKPDFWKPVLPPIGNGIWETDYWGTVLQMTLNSKGDMFALVASITSGYHIYRSTDNGDTWIDINNGLPVSYYQSIQVNNQDVIFVTSSDFIARSNDNGNTWTQLKNGLPFGVYYNLKINSKGYLFATNGNLHTGNGLFRSIDNGDSWSIVGMRDTTILNGLWLDKQGNLYVRTQYTIYKSTDDGVKWSNFYNNGYGYTGQLVAELFFNSKNDIFVKDYNGSKYVLSRSKDNGKTWVQLDTNITIGLISIDPNDNIYSVSSLATYCSIDNGDKWIQLGGGINRQNISTLFINKNGDIFAGSDKGYLFKAKSINKLSNIKLSINILTFLSSKNSSPPSPQVFNIYKEGESSFSYKITKSSSWLNISPTSGTDTGRIAVSINTTNLNVGTYLDTIVISSNEALNSPQKVIVSYTISEKPMIQLSTNSYDYNILKTSNKLSKIFNIKNNGGQDLKLTSAIISGTDKSEFNLKTNIDNITINTGNSQDITIEFSPKSSGNKSAYCIITSNADNKPVDTLTLRGIGIDPSINLSNPNDAAIFGNDKTISLSLKETYTPAKVIIYYRPGGAIKYDSSVLTSTSTSNYPYTFSKELVSIRGIEYYMKISWDTIQGTLPETDYINHPLFLPVKINSIECTSKLSDKKYSLLSIPLSFTGSDSILFKQIIRNFGKVDNTQWRILRWIKGKYEEMLYENAMDIKPGEGFWMITSGDKTLTFKEGLTTPTNYDYKIKLQPGWNQIGNPFLFPISASNLIIPQGKKVEKLWEWNNQINDYKIQENVMSLWSGYFIKNNESDSVEISIHPIYYSRSVETRRQLINNESTNNNELSLNDRSLDKNDGVSVQLGNGEWKIYIENIIQFGCLQNANDEWDENDLSEPPPAPISDNVETRQQNINNESSNINDGVSVQNNISIRFPHPEWRECKANYVRDFRPIGKDGYIWNMEITNNESQATSYELIFNTIGNFPESFQMVLYDLDKSVKIEPINKNNGQMNYNIKFGIEQKKKNLRVIVGTKEYVENESRKTEHEIRKYALWQNYPNPFNPSTVISYQLPVNSYVSLKIYNTLGQEVQTLVNEYKQTGSYSIEWKPDNLPSGVYFYRIQAEKYNEIKKMIYIR